jgi:hypothetical protein
MENHHAQKPDDSSWPNSGPPLKFANGKTAIARRSSNLAVVGDLEPVAAAADLVSTWVYPVDADGSVDVLEVLRTEIDEIEIDLTRDPLMDCAGNVDAARLRERLKPGCDIDPVSEEIAIVRDDDVVHVDPDTESNPPLGQQCFVPSRRCFTQRRPASHGLNDALELEKYLIAGPPDDASAKFEDLRLDTSVRKRLNPLNSPASSPG